MKLEKKITIRITDDLGMDEQQSFDISYELDNKDFELIFKEGDGEDILKRNINIIAKFLKNVPDEIIKNMHYSTKGIIIDFFEGWLERIKFDGAEKG